MGNPRNNRKWVLTVWGVVLVTRRGSVTRDRSLAAIR